MAVAVLFDLGNTLAAYYHANEFRPILADAIGAVRDELQQRGLANVSLESAVAAAAAENREESDYRFMPMIGRLERIFGLRMSSDPLLAATVCERFLGPIFTVGRVYDDTLGVLADLKSADVRTAIVSNAPWGSPPDLWREELQRLGLAQAVDAVVLCGDVGWRKPAPHIFQHARKAVGCTAEECIFVGDDLRWDIEGSKAAGMRPVLIDRDGRHAGFPGERIETLAEVLAIVDAKGRD